MPLRHTGNESEGSTGFRAPRKHPCANRKGVYGFQGDLNPVGPEGSPYRVFIL